MTEFKFKKIFAENAEQEQWRMLLQFSYPLNIKKSIQNRFDKYSLDEDNIETIAGSIAQAFEYFEASRNASLFISPILLYYGITNLLFGIISLKTGKEVKINNHGLSLTVEKGNLKKLGDVIINTSGDKSGAFRIYYDSLCLKNNIQIVPWQLSEIFKSIPEIKNELESCYDDEFSHCIPVQVVKGKKERLERIQKSDVLNINDLDLPSMIEDYQNCYLQPNPTNEYIILRRKINSDEIGYYSLTGHKYLFLYHLKNNKKISIPVIVSMFMGLFALCSLSRYYPGIWYRFVQSDSTGEKALIDKFLSVCKRFIPNILLNYFNDKHIIFTNERQGLIEKDLLYTEQEIKQLIKGELQRY